MFLFLPRPSNCYPGLSPYLWNSPLLFLSSALFFLPPHCPRGLGMQSLFLSLSLPFLCQAPLSPVSGSLLLFPELSPCWFLKSVSVLCPLPCLPSPSLVSCPLCLPNRIPGSLAHHFPGWSGPPSSPPARTPGDGWGGSQVWGLWPAGKRTQADMIFMLGLQSGAEPKAGMVGAGGGGRPWEGGRQKPD